ncbi:MAG: PDZ domain-containing protein [Gemmatimonadota bacterium]|jgi:membrane-associated protease RseP (regulator of RpoE activity)
MRTIRTALFLVLGVASAPPLAAQAAGRDTLPRAEEIEEKMARLRREMEALRAQQRELEARGRQREQQGRVERRVMVRADGPTATICEYRERRPEGWLGISFAPPRRASIVRGRGPVLTFDGPFAVDEVVPASPAARAGIAVGDTITMLNGEPVAGRQIAFETLLRPGSTLAVQVRRAGKARDLKVEITARPGDDRETCREIASPMPFFPGMPNPLVDMVFEMDSAEAGRRGRDYRTARGTAVILPAAPDIPDPPRPPGFSFTTTRELVFVFGAQFGTLTEELQELTGVRKGVFVTSVAEGSPAAAGGLRAADVIQKVGEMEVSSPRDLRRALPSGERSAVMTVVRKKKAQVLTVNW